MSWFRTHIAALTSRDNGRTHNNHTLPTPITNGDDASDQKLFELFWRDASSILNKPYPSQEKPIARSSSIDDCEILIHFTDKMVKLLTNNNSDCGCDAQLLDAFFAEGVLDKLLAFSQQKPEYWSRLTRHQLGLYDTLIGQSQQQLLAERRFVRPLLKLLHACKKDQLKNEIVEEKLMIVLHQLCMAITQNSSLLDVLIESGDQDSDGGFFDLSMLLPYVHRVGSAGQQARDDLLLLMSMSSRHDVIGKYITEKTDFCQVFVVSLSGLYSSLPRTLTYGSDDWHGIAEEDVTSNVDLQMFLNLLEFCSALVQVSHPVIQDQLLNFVYNGFLVSVIGPTLHQVQSGMEEAIAVTAYMDLFLRKIAEPRLLRIFLKFLLLGKMEDMTILEALVQRINSANTRLCMVTMALFKTLVDLNCEDVMFQLVFKYLLPCSHIMVSQQRSVTDVDVYGKTAEKLISLIPPSCIIEHRNADNGCATTTATEELSPGTPWNNRHWFPFRSKSRPTISESSYTVAEAKCPVEANSPAEYRRISSPLGTEAEPIVPESPASRRSSSSHWELGSSPPINTRQWDSSYLDYLQLARVSIEECIAACRNWSSQYGGGELQTPSITSSPSSSAPSDSFTSSDDPERSGSDAGSKELPATTEMTSMVSCETPESVGPATPVCKRHNDLLSFLVQLNRVQLPEGSEESEDILAEFDALLLDAIGRGISESDGVLETPEGVIYGRPRSENAGRNSGLEPLGDFPDGGSSGGRSAASEAAQVQGSDVKDEGTKVEKEAKMPEQQLVGLAKRYAGLSGSPTIGPFLTALLNKLEAMKQNSLYVNLQLTGLIARLACYPQPLLSSLLLSHTLVFQPSIKSLMQVLNTIKCRTEEFLYKMKEKDQMLEHAYNFLLWRLSCHERTDGDDKSSRRNSLMTLNSPKPIGETKMSSVMSRLKLLDNKRGAYYANKQPKAAAAPAVARETQEMLEKKNAIYCAVVFKEFLKELAAISQEHAFLLNKEAS